jgi:hypothetical protein
MKIGRVPHHSLFQARLAHVFHSWVREKENVAQSELHALKRLSKVLLNLSDEQINASLRSRELVKVVENGGG